MLDSYTVKKMLPRLIIAVVAVNISFYICRLLLEWSNVLGRGVNELITAPFDIQPINTFVSQIGNYLGVGALVGAGALLAVAWPTLLTILALGAVALLVGYLTVLVRQVLIVMLVILSPIAIALWVIPGTESWAKRWFNTYIKLLLMYPLIVVFIASGKILASVTGGIAPDATGVIDIPNATAGVAAIIALFAPYFLLPLTFKFAGGAMAAVGGFIAGHASKQISERTSKGLDDINARRGRTLRKQAAKDAKLGVRKQQAQGVALGNINNKKGLRGWNARRGLGRGQARDDNLAILAAQHAQEELRVPAAQEQARKSQLTGESFALQEESRGKDRQTMVENLRKAALDTNASTARREAAIAMLTSQKDTAGLEQVQEAALQSEPIRLSWNQAMQDNYGDLKSTSPHLTTEIPASMASMPSVEGRLQALSSERLGGFTKASDEQLAAMHQTGWKSFQAINPEEARRRFEEVYNNEKLRVQLTNDTIGLFPPRPTS